MEELCAGLAEAKIVKFSPSNFKAVICTCTYIQVRQKKCIHTLTKENSTLCNDYCKSTIYFRQHNNMIYVFTSI